MGWTTSHLQLEARCLSFPQGICFCRCLCSCRHSGETRITVVVLAVVVAPAALARFRSSQPLPQLRLLRLPQPYTSINRIQRLPQRPVRRSHLDAREKNSPTCTRPSTVQNDPVAATTSAPVPVVNTALNLLPVLPHPGPGQLPASPPGSTPEQSAPTHPGYAPPHSPHTPASESPGSAPRNRVSIPSVSFASPGSVRLLADVEHLLIERPVPMRRRQRHRHIHQVRLRRLLPCKQVLHHLTRMAPAPPGPPPPPTPRYSSVRSCPRSKLSFPSARPHRRIHRPKLRTLTTAFSSLRSSAVAIFARTCPTAFSAASTTSAFPSAFTASANSRNSPTPSLPRPHHRPPLPHKPNPLRRTVSPVSTPAVIARTCSGVYAAR